MKKNTAPLKNIGNVEAPGLVFDDCNITSKISMSPRQLINRIKSSKDSCKDETSLISLEKNLIVSSNFCFGPNLEMKQRQLLNI